MGILSSILDIANNAIFSSSSQSLTKVDQVYNTSFSTSNIFEVQEFRNSYFDGISAIHSQQIISAMKTALIDFNISELQNTDIEEWVNYKWYYTTGRPNINRITLNFRDLDNSMLYTYFKEAWWRLKDKLPEQQRWNISILSKNDTAFYNSKSKLTDINNTDGTVIIQTSDIILDSVSGIQLDKSRANDFATFSVTFRYFVNYLKN